MKGQMFFPQDPRPRHEYSRGDLVHVDGHGRMIVMARKGHVRIELGSWECNYLLCPTNKDGMMPNMHTWNTGGGSKRIIQAVESDITLVKYKFYTGQ